MTEWTIIGRADELARDLEASGNLKEIELESRKIVLSYQDGEFGALNNKCNHMGGPLAKGKIKKGCIECPWHYWHFDRKSGEAVESEMSKNYVGHGGAVPRIPLKIENGNLLINLKEESPRVRAQYKMMTNVGREPKREQGKIRVLGLSTTAMDSNYPRYSTSEDLLEKALGRAGQSLDVETRMLSLSQLNFKNCEGFYSKSEKACTWPCSITKIDPQDEMIQVYENLVHWADVVILSTPIRWGNASSLYYKMAERLNSVQNQITVNNRVLIRNKVMGLIITGGQDNIQSVAGQILNFFGELGFAAPPFPYVGHSLGWSAEKMEQNMDYVRSSEALHQSSFDLIERAVGLASKLVENKGVPAPVSI